MTDEELQFTPDQIDRSFEQGEAVDGGALNGRQIGIVGLVAGVADLAITLRRERMHDADLEAGRGEGLANDVVVSAGAFDGDDEVMKCIFLVGFTQAFYGGIQIGAVMFNNGGWDQDVAEKVAQHPLGTRFGTIDADNAKMLRADTLHPWLDHSSVALWLNR